MSGHEPKSERSTIRLCALEGAPLRSAGVRKMVLATARAVAERTGVTLARIRADERSVTLTIAGNRIAAMGLALELRRLTTAWYADKFGEPALWGEASPGPMEAGEDEGSGGGGEGGGGRDDEDYFHDEGEEWKRG